MILLLFVPSPVTPIVMGTVNPVAGILTVAPPTAQITPQVPQAAIQVH